MDMRQKDISDLRELRKELVAVDQLSQKLEKLNQEIRRDEQTIKENENVLRGKYSGKWKEIYFAHNADKVRRECDAENFSVATRRENTVKAIGVVINALIFALSIFVLATAEGGSWIRTSEYKVLFWIVHVVLGLALTFIPLIDFDDV